MVFVVGTCQELFPSTKNYLVACVACIVVVDGASPDHISKPSRDKYRLGESYLGQRGLFKGRFKCAR